MLRVLVTRHGQSVWNEQGRWQGQADPPLSDLGLAQAREAAASVGAVDAVVTSDLERSITTARIISETIGVGPVLVEPRLRERHSGGYEGLTRTEIEERFPGHLDGGKWPPGWESDESLLARALAALDDIARSTPAGDVLVVAHAGVIYAIEAHLGQPHNRIPNLSGRWFIHADTGWSLGERVALIADIVVPDLL